MRLVVIDGQTLSHCLFFVVLALDEHVTGFIVAIWDFRRVVDDVINTSRLFVNTSSTETFYDFFVGYGDFQNSVEMYAGIEHRLRLDDRARESIEQKSVRAVGLCDAFFDQRD